MANANRTVWAAGHQKFSAVNTEVFNSRTEAENRADELRKEGKRVRLTSFRLGSRARFDRNYCVRVYEAN